MEGETKKGKAKRRFYEICRNVGMDYAETAEFFADLDQLDGDITQVAQHWAGQLHHGGGLQGRSMYSDGYVSWPAAEGVDHVVLDGTYTRAQLRALLWWMDNHMSVLASPPSFEEPTK